VIKIVLDKAKKHENKVKTHIDRNYNKYDRVLHKIIDKLTITDKNILKHDQHNEKIIKGYDTWFNNFLGSYEKKIMPYADFARKTTVPINFPYFLYLKIKRRYDTNILFADGVHFFVALQGGGKSTLAFELIERLRIKTGKGSYVNADFELPKQDQITKKHYTWHTRFNLLDFFNIEETEINSIKVSQLKRFNRNFDNIVLDEWLTEMNHRLNKTKGYNNIFMGLISMIAEMRHQRIRRIYVLSQIDNTDTQLLSMFKYQHEIQIDLDVSYKDWIETGMMERHIKGWHVWTYGNKRRRKRNTRSNQSYLIKKQYIKKTADFTSFDTFSQATKYETLLEDQIKLLI